MLRRFALHSAKTTLALSTAIRIRRNGNARAINVIHSVAVLRAWDPIRPVLILNSAGISLYYIPTNIKELGLVGT